VLNLLTSREVGLMIHLGLGVVLVHSFAGGIATLVTARMTRAKEIIRSLSAAGLALVAWLTVVTGTWMVYPGYRAEPASDAADLSAYPRSALLADENVSFWHEFGMEWKEHIGWLAPFLATAVAYIAIRHTRLLSHDRTVQRAVTATFVIAFAIAVIAGLLGAFINTVAPNQFLDV
jgi:hypothetical protein